MQIMLITITEIIGKSEHLIILKGMKFAESGNFGYKWTPLRELVGPILLTRKEAKREKKSRE